MERGGFVVSIRDVKVSQSLQVDADLKWEKAMTRVRQNTAVKKQQPVLLGTEQATGHVEEVHKHNIKRAKAAEDKTDSEPPECSGCRSPKKNIFLKDCVARDAMYSSYHKKDILQRNAVQQVMSMTFPIRWRAVMRRILLSSVKCALRGGRLKSCIWLVKSLFSIWTQERVSQQFQAACSSLKGIGHCKLYEKCCMDKEITAWKIKDAFEVSCELKTKRFQFTAHQQEDLKAQYLSYFQRRKIKRAQQNQVGARCCPICPYTTMPSDPTPARQGESWTAAYGEYGGYGGDFKSDTAHTLVRGMVVTLKA